MRRVLLLLLLGRLHLLLRWRLLLLLLRRLWLRLLLPPARLLVLPATRLQRILLISTPEEGHRGQEVKPQLGHVS